SFSAIGIDSIFPSLQEGHLIKEESGEHEAHQKHEGHNRKFTLLSVSIGTLPVVSILPGGTCKVFFLKTVCSSSIKRWRFTRST
ncbi:MAG TPA: hypothetical protein VFY68_14740, partial [Nitrososphaeraceae archaeon]|nr:hypothetical protein [Nitrososphaeraceae archaeon]